MKTILALFMLFSMTVSAQKLDTIYANDNKNVALFFPKPIRQGITGASSFVFTYNREKEQYFGLLQAKPGIESNLLTVTNDGKVYAYILKYKKELSKLNYFIDESESIGNEIPKVIHNAPTIPTIYEQEISTKYYRKFADYVLKKSSKRLATKRKKGLWLQLQNQIYNGNEVYLGLALKNNSGIDLQVDYIKVFKVNGNKKRKSSYQKLEMKPVYKFQVPNVVKNYLTEKFVLVLPKFVLGDTEKLLIEVREKKGNRKLIL